MILEGSSEIFSRANGNRQEIPSLRSGRKARKAKLLDGETVVHGGVFFQSKGTWGCAARKSILFRTSSLAKGYIFRHV